MYIAHYNVDATFLESFPLNRSSAQLNDDADRMWHVCHAAGGLPVDRLIDQIFPLDQAPQAFNRASTPGTLKILLQMPEGR